MKRNISVLLSFILFFIIVSARQVQKKDPVGVWKFEIPDGPEGYRSGSLNIAMTDKKYSASMFFPEYSIKIPAEKVSVVKDSIFFIMYTEGREVSISLKMTGPLKMQGKAVHSEGEIALSLTKESKPQ